MTSSWRCTPDKGSGRHNIIRRIPRQRRCSAESFKECWRKAVRYAFFCETLQCLRSAPRVAKAEIRKRCRREARRLLLTQALTGSWFRGQVRIYIQTQRLLIFLRRCQRVMLATGRNHIRFRRAHSGAQRCNSTARRLTKTTLRHRMIMAISQSTPAEPLFSQKSAAPASIPRAPLDDRLLTVGDHLPSVPFLRLQGRWLEEAGFPKGTKVRVNVTSGCLVIQPIPITSERPPRLPRGGTFYL